MKIISTTLERAFTVFPVEIVGFDKGLFNNWHVWKFIQVYTRFKSHDFIFKMTH